MTLKLNTRILILTVCLLSSAVLSAQTQLQRMEKDPKAGAGIYCPYSYDAASEVSKPEGGYKPFYISHFGRHGSRYFSRPHEKDFVFVIDIQIVRIIHIFMVYTTVYNIFYCIFSKSLQR